MAPSAFLFPVNMATLRTLGLPVMKWMVRRISRPKNDLTLKEKPYSFEKGTRERT
jgi:hypothetical protein